MHVPSKNAVVPLNVFVPSIRHNPWFVIVPFNVRLPAPVMLAAVESVAVPPRIKVVPDTAVKLPSLLASVNDSEPLLTSTDPALLQGTVALVVPMPSVLRIVPAFTTRGLPVTVLKHGPSDNKSNVAAGALLNTTALSQLIAPPLQLPATLLISVPPERPLIDAAL